jgi:RNA polymerase sigma factor (sigma-70 family)
MTYTDEILLEGLREQKMDCIKYLYRNYFPLVKSIVVKNSGSYEDAEDVFQDGLITLYHKASTGRITLNCNLKTFFYSICKNIWFQRLDRKWRLLYQDEILNEPTVEYENEENELTEVKLEKMRLFHVHFLSLPDECQKLLTCFVAKIPLKEIAKLMGFKNERYAKQRKYLCKNMLRKRIKNDPRSKWLFIYDGTG